MCNNSFEVTDESENLNTAQKKLSDKEEKKSEEKWIELYTPIGRYYQAYHHMCNESPRRKEKEERIFEEIRAPNSPYFI